MKKKKNKKTAYSLHDIITMNTRCIEIILACSLVIASLNLVSMALNSSCDSSSNESLNQLEVTIRTDAYPDEIYWLLWQGKWGVGNTDNTTTTLIVNPSNSTNNSYLFERYCGLESKSVCIPNDCFTLYLYDSGYPDPDRGGICCGAGFGYYQIRLNNEIITMSKSQYYTGDGTLLYFCTDLIGNNSVVGSNRKDLVYSSQEVTRIMVNRISKKANTSINTTIYDAISFVPFGEAYQVSLPTSKPDVETIEILIFQAKDGASSYNYSIHKWNLVHYLTSDDDWIIRESTVKGGMWSQSTLYFYYLYIL